LALYHKVLPPTIKVERPAEAANCEDSAFYVNTSKRPWLPSAEHPRRASVSAFGFGGSNFHCVLEEHDAKKPGIDWDENVEIVALVGNSLIEVRQQFKEWSEVLSQANPDWNAVAAKAAESRVRSDRIHAVQPQDPINRVTANSAAAEHRLVLVLHK